MRYLLDTNTVSHLLRARPEVQQRVLQVPMESLCISAVTEGELLFGIARRPDAFALHNLVSEFLRRVDVEPWGREAASCYGATAGATVKARRNSGRARPDDCGARHEPRR